MIAALIAAIGAVLLIAGLAVSVPARNGLRSGSREKTPVWKVPEDAFESPRAYAMFQIGSWCLVAGCLLVATASLIRIFQD